MTSRSGRPVIALLGTLGIPAVIAAVVFSLLPAAPAVASPGLASATQRAAALRGQVDRLRITAEVATEEYDGTQARLADVVTQHALAQRQLDVAHASSTQDDQIADDRVRAIYMTGGRAGLISSILEAKDLGDAVARIHTVQSLVGDDRARVNEGAQSAQVATDIEARLRRLTTERVALGKRAAAAADRIVAALTSTQQLLAGADANVRRIADADRRAAEAAAAQAFAAQLSAAQGAASLLALGPGSAPTAAAGVAIAAARTRLGRPYVWGATGPDSFDCSGLTGWAYRQAGVRLPRTSREQWAVGPHVDLAHLAPGDLLFWATNRADPDTIHHVALYIGGGLMIAAPQPGDVVKVQAVYLNGYLGAVRPSA